MIHPMRRIALSAALWLLPYSLPLAAGPLQAPTGESGWRAREVGGEICVSDRDGERVGCWSRALGEMNDLRETARGWIAAGHGPVAGGTDLYLRRDRGDGVEVVLPPPAAGLARGRPQLVTDDLRLLGLVWLEGATQNELQVRAAERRSDGWGPVVTVSPSGGGSQLAPTVTVLADGRWLLLWTALDGHDDETLWSVYDGGRWTPPAPLHEDNETPDILPVVVATRDGAIAAWSWLDGRDYRLRTAFFDGVRWHPAPALEGRGGLDARFSVSSGTLLMTFSTVVPDEWRAYELDSRGRVLHRAAIDRTVRREPVVEAVGNGVAFRWLDGEAPGEVLAPWDGER